MAPDAQARQLAEDGRYLVGGLSSADRTDTYRLKLGQVNACSGVDINAGEVVAKLPTLDYWNPWDLWR
jgi:hypothetical protein